MPDLVIRIKRNADGGAALTCIRSDGTTTWQRHALAHGQFFAFHDLTHYAVETVLGLRHGFYGLLAEGWNITDFGAPWPRGPLPVEALAPELIVGFLDSERASGERWTADDFNEKARLYAEQHHLAQTRAISDDELAQIRKTRSELFERWTSTPPGETLELIFDRVEMAPAKSEHGTIERRSRK